jgi:hypothetical protein
MERVSVTRWMFPSPEGGEWNRGEESSLGAYRKTDDDEESRDDVGSIRFRRVVNLKGGRRAPDRKRAEPPFICPIYHSPPPNDRVI